MAIDRQKLVRAVCALALILALTIALTFTGVGPAAARDLPPIKTIGIVVDVGDKVHYTHIGFMVFSNAKDEREFPEWRIDAFIAGELEAALKERYELREVEFAKGSIAPNLEPAFFSNPSPEDNVRAGVTPKDGAPVDAYLVVWPSKGDVYPTNQIVTGLGLMTRGSFTGIHAKLQMTLVDGRTFKKLDRCTVRTKDGDINNMRERKDLAAESFDAMTPDQMAAFEQAVKELIRDGLAYCLNDVKLTP